MTGPATDRKRENPVRPAHPIRTPDMPLCRLHRILAGTTSTRMLRRPTMPLNPLESLVKAGTKLWLDSIDPVEVAANRALGATGATSNPIIVSDLIKTGRFDPLIKQFSAEGLSDEAIAWKMTDHLVKQAQDVF